MRRVGYAAALLALAACAPEIPDSGVGFNDYGDYASSQAQARAAREAQLSNSTVFQPPEATDAPSATAVPNSSVTSADLAAAGIGTSTAGFGMPAPAPVANQVITPAAGTPMAVTPAGAAYAAGDNPGLSDEQDFAAVSARQSIQSDAERLAQQKAQYQVVSAEAVPQRPGSTGPDIVAYALQSSNPVGQRAYQRTIPSAARAARKCATYHSDDMAQLAFLEAGGPYKDRYGIDPDGDGFACNWDPGLYRSAVNR